jgi:hypothetical protein
MKISKKLILWCAFLVILFVQVPHLAWVFSAMSSFPDEWMRLLHGTLFAISIDACVLLFALRGRELYTLTFMTASLVVTIQYYRDYINFEVDALLAWSTIFISLVGVLAVYFLSREVKAIYIEEKAASSIDEHAKRDSELQAILQEREDAVRAELSGEDVLSFSADEVEIIKLRRADKSYDEIISEFQSDGKPISKDKISKTVKKFKEVYS